MEYDDENRRPQRRHAATGSVWEWDEECDCWWLQDCPEHCVAVEVGRAEVGGVYWHVSFMDGSSMDGRCSDEDEAFGAAVEALENPVPPGSGPFPQ
ncbi:MAG: hypothetical protein AB2A00_14585 [Myxococcota bacterium]